jgi:hypothetical protein
MRSLFAAAAAVSLRTGEFGLFIKQVLYFDRYTRILAPQLKVFDDARVNWKADGTFDSPEVILPSAGGGSSGSSGSTGGGFAYS